MLGTALIVFRETLEVALILGLLLAATRGLSKRTHWVLLGIAAGLVGASLVAVFADAINNAVEGMGQEVFNGSVLLLAAAMVGWTVVWMKHHAMHIVAHVKHVGAQVAKGELPMVSLAVVVAIAVLREGAETVLFTYSLLVSGTSWLEVLSGGALGLAGGTAVGVAIYFGLIKMATKHIFTVTSWMLILLAAGMAAHAAGYFVAAGMLPELISQVWDSSWLLAQDSMVGQVLGILIGYTDRPSGIQVLFYIATIALIWACMKLFVKPHNAPARASA